MSTIVPISEANRDAFSHAPFVNRCLRANSVLALLFLIVSLSSLSSASAKRVVAWGTNTDGQTNVPPGLDAVAIAAGASHSLALKADGTVVAWGYNGYGAATVPPGLTGVAAIAAGANHSLALKSDGTMVGWGYNFYGATSIPAGLSGVTAIAGGAYHSLALKSDGTVVAWGYDGYGGATVPAGLRNVTAIAAGAYHSVALKNDGTVVAWGYNLFGVATVPSGLSGVVAIAAGNYHTLALKSNGTVVAWGNNSTGAASVPSGLTGVSSLTGGAYHSLALKSNGAMVNWGSTSGGLAIFPTGVTRITGITAGYYHNLALDTPPQAPVVDLGPDQHVAEGALVTLDARASYDGNNPPRPLTAPLWKQIAGPSVALASPNSLITTFAAPSVPRSGAVLTFGFSVSNDFTTASGTINVNVDNVNRAPTAIAGAEQSVEENTAVVLQGDGTDPDGDSLTLTWTQIAGPIVILEGSDTTSPSFVAPAVSAVQGSVDLKFRLIVNDGLVSSGPSDVVVHVLNTNDAPIANGGGDKSVNEGDLMTLNGASSSDPNGDPLTFQWTQIAGSPVADLQGADSSTASFIAPNVAFGGTTLTFRLSVSDGELMDSNVVNVRVNNVNHAPLADAGDNQVVPEGSSVNLDGSASADVDGDALTYLWEQIDGSPVELANSSTAKPTFTAPDVDAGDANLVFKLTVNDGFGGIARDTVQVRVKYVNRPPTANAGADRVCNEGQSVNLQGTATDPDGNALTCSWTQLSGPIVTLTDSTALDPMLTAPPVSRAGDSVIFRLTVSDPYGGSATDDVIIRIANVNRAPTAEAPDNLSVREGEAVTLIGSGIDPDNEEQNDLIFAWQQMAGPKVALIGSGANVNFTAPLLNAKGDAEAKVMLTFRLTVTDPNGAIGTDDVDIAVANVDHSPIARAGGNMNADEGASVTLNGSASSDPDDDVISCSWVQTGGPSVILEDANTPYPHFMAPSVKAAGATLKFMLTVSDGFGGVSNDIASVTILNLGEAPDITKARPSIAVLWPPNHRMVPVSIAGIADAGDGTAITITGVIQNEPTEDQGKHETKRDRKPGRDKSSNDSDESDHHHKDQTDTSMDAIINPDGTVLLRAERSGNGDGRVYQVSFTASNAQGTSSGVVKVLVPHSRKSSEPKDNGVWFDSVTGAAVQATDPRSVRHGHRTD